MTGLNALTNILVTNLKEKILRDQVRPWAFFNTGKFESKDFHGNGISREGSMYDEAASRFFWSNYIEPFILDGSLKIFLKTLKFARNSRTRIVDCLDEAAIILARDAREIFREMALIDRRLTGQGKPTDVGFDTTEKLQDVTFEIFKLKQAIAGTIKIGEEYNRWSAIPKEYPVLYPVVAAVLINLIIELVKYLLR